MTSYAQKLRDPRWQKKRLFIMDRDGFRCVVCGSARKTLNVHHVVYRRGKDPWDYDDDCLQTLCEDCHSTRQELSDKAADALRISLKDIPTERLDRTADALIKTAMEAL